MCPSLRKWYFERNANKGKTTELRGKCSGYSDHFARAEEIFEQCDVKRLAGYVLM
jgi:hypothetical protein